MHYYLQIMNKSLNQEVFVPLLQLQNTSVIYPFFNDKKNDSTLHFNVLLLEKSSCIHIPEAWKKKKKTFRGEAMEPSHIGHYREYSLPRE